VDVQLVREGYVNPEAISSAPGETADKRAQQGFCFRKTRSGRYLPYICSKKGQKIVYSTASGLCGHYIYRAICRVSVSVDNFELNDR